jgi:hypothetical protein
MDIKLSILIPTVYGREAELKNLIDILVGNKEVSIEASGNVLKASLGKCSDFNIWIYQDNKTMTIGEKRERLYQLSDGIYSWQIDDDDSIAPNAIEKILAAIDNNPDCITFEERCDMNGEIKRSNHSLKYDRWQDNFDGFDYVRSPFYKDVIKTEIARSVPFPHIRYNEDEQWSMALLPHLKNEIHIDEQLYYYSYYPKETHNERYGIDKS